MIAAGLLAAAVLASPPTMDPGAKRALLIGVHYQDDRLQLNTDRDVKLVSETLTNDRFGFAPAAVVVKSTSDETTRDGILKAFDDLVLATQKGDIVYVQYSGHGDQIPDRDGDEADGYDETLVPSNVSESGDNQVTDDEVGRFIDHLMAKAPASVTIIFDCCHSGTIARGPKARKIPATFWKNRVDVVPASHPGESSGGMIPKGPGSTALVVMSAARSDQPAFETTKGDSMGAFSFGLVKALSSPDVGPQTTARELFDRICQHVKEQNQLQVPMIEGQLDMEFLGGEVRPSQPYLPIEFKAGQLTVPAGVFHGLTEGSEFEIHRAGAASPTDATRLAKATIKSTSTFESELTLTEGDAAALREMSGLRAFEIKRAAPDNGIRLAIDPAVQKEGTWLAVESALKAFQLVSGMTYTASTKEEMPAGDYNVLVESSKPGSIRLYRKDGTPLATPELDLTAPDSNQRLQEALNQEARWQFLYAMRNTASNSGVKVQLRVIPVEVKPDPDNAGSVVYVKDRQHLPETGGEINIRKNEYFRIEVKNIGTQDAYVNLLSMESTGNVGLIFPDPGDSQANAAFSPCSADEATDPEKGWIKLENPDGLGGKLPIVWQISPDPGLEVFKLLATLDKVRVEPFLTPATAKGARGGGSFMEEFIKASTLGQRTNRASKGAVKDWWADQLNIRIGD
jgi:hypothetical protein